MLQRLFRAARRWCGALLSCRWDLELLRSSRILLKAGDAVASLNACRARCGLLGLRSLPNTAPGNQAALASTGGSARSRLRRLSWARRAGGNDAPCRLSAGTAARHPAARAGALTQQ